MSDFKYQILQKTESLFVIKVTRKSSRKYSTKEIRNHDAILILLEPDNHFRTGIKSRNWEVHCQSQI